MGRAGSCRVWGSPPPLFMRGGSLGRGEFESKPKPKLDRRKDSFFLPLGNHCSSLTFQTSLLTFNLELYLSLANAQPSDLGHDPIIPLNHETFMNHSPSGPMNLLDPSRTSPMKTSKSFPNSGIGLSLYESYSPDHSESPRDIPDPIRDSEQHSVSLLTFHIY